MITAIITALTALIPKLADKYDRYLENKAKILQGQQKVVELENQLKIAQINADSSLGDSQIKATGPWFKYIAYFIFNAAFIITTFFPEYGMIIFKNWAIMPEWYATAIVVLNFTVWGIAVSKNTIANIINNASSFFSKRKQIKVNEKLMFDTLRNHAGPVTQREVDLIKKSLEIVNNETNQDK